MSLKRRVILLGGAATVGFWALGYYGITRCDEVACFSFEFQGADHVANRLDVQHTGGQESLQAGDVYFREVVVDWESRETDTIAWSELDDEMEPSDTIDGDEIRLQLLWETNVVEILWRQEGEETLIGAWVDEDDDAR